MAKKKVDDAKKSEEVTLKKSSRGKAKRDDRAENDMERSDSAGIHNALSSPRRPKGKTKAADKTARNMGSLTIMGSDEVGNAGKTEMMTIEENTDKKGKGKRKGAPEDRNTEKTKSPQKRRNPDNKIAYLNMSLAVKGSYNLRARKAIPSFQRIRLSESGSAKILGKSVKVYKPGLKKWNKGEIESYHPKKKVHKIKYINGDSEEFDLSTQLFEVELMPGEASTLCLEYKPKTAKSPKGSNCKSVNAAKEGNSKVQKQSTDSKGVKGQKGKKRTSSKQLEDQNRKNEGSDEDIDIDVDQAISEIVEVSQKKKGPKKRVIESGTMKDGKQLNVEKKTRTINVRSKSKTKN